MTVIKFKKIAYCLKNRPSPVKSASPLGLIVCCC